MVAATVAVAEDNIAQQLLLADMSANNTTIFKELN
jgi:hypothetical protein